MGKLTQKISKLILRLSSWPVLVLVMVFLPCGACWDTIQHVYACDDAVVATGQCTADTATDTITDSDSEVDTAIDTSTSTVPEGQGVQPEGWEGFGSPCDDDADCQEINPEWVCIHSVIDLINAPGGYCTACCNASGQDGCAPGIDCVGADGVYLVCLGHCAGNDQCRTAIGWECRDLYYIGDDFPGEFCLPDTDHAAPDTDYEGEMPDCNWPW